MVPEGDPWVASRALVPHGDPVGKDSTPVWVVGPMPLRLQDLGIIGRHEEGDGDD